MTSYASIESPLGTLLLTSRDEKLTGLYFADQRHAWIAPGWIEREDEDIFIQTARQIEEYAAGERTEFDLPLSLAGTPLQTAVWRAIAAIPFGRTITYGELAQRASSPRAVRAVGTATGANPISWIVPCHRVVGKSGALTGYAGGLPRKRALLEFEAAKSAGHDVQLAFGVKELA
jgi:methylated-DNA-[protein]-cysteine S-methyltransferase